MYKIMCLCGDFWIEYASTNYADHAEDIAAFYRSRGHVTRIDTERKDVTLGKVVGPNNDLKVGG